LPTNVPKIIVGNKADKGPATTAWKFDINVAEEFNAEVLLASAKLN
jgi:hypothetical protein